MDAVSGSSSNVKSENQKAMLVQNNKKFFSTKEVKNEIRSDFMELLNLPGFAYYNN